jgi:hypothetical protein
MRAFPGRTPHLCPSAFVSTLHRAFHLALYPMSPDCGFVRLSLVQVWFGGVQHIGRTAEFSVSEPCLHAHAEQSRS